MRIEAAPLGVSVEPFDDEVERAVTQLLGLEFDLAAFTRFARDTDPLLAGLVDRLAGFRPPLAPEPFETLVTAITAQQVSLRAAFAIRNRLIEQYGKKVGCAYAFPLREALASAGEDDLVRLGLSPPQG